MDLYATALALAGVDHASGVDAYDLSPTLLAGRPSAREVFFYYRAGELRAARKGRYKLVMVSEGAYGMPPQRVVHEPPKLYDLHIDPGERYDVALRHADVVAAMLKDIAQHRAELQQQPPLFDARLSSRASVTP